VIEHDMEFVKQIAQRIVVLHQGEKLTEGSVNEVQSNPKVIEVYLGREQINAA
ncbi:MAG: ABC transporter ATP-binding protein, partial [Pseudanabaena sp.]